MRLVMGTAVVLGVVATAGLAGCSGDDDGDRDDIEAFASVGGSDSACPLPVVFDRDEGWVPKRPKVEEITDADVRESLASLTSPGPFDLACELSSPVDLGAIRVYTGPATLAGRDPEVLLKTFVDAYEDGAARDVAFAPLTAESGTELVEVTYERYDDLDEAYVPRRAFLAPGDGGLALFVLGGLDAEEHDGMRPAYDLALRSVRAADRT